MTGLFIGEILGARILSAGPLLRGLSKVTGLFIGEILRTRILSLGP